MSGPVAQISKGCGMPTAVRQRPLTCGDSAYLPSGTGLFGTGPFPPAGDAASRANSRAIPASSLSSGVSPASCCSSLNASASQAFAASRAIFRRFSSGSVAAFARCTASCFLQKSDVTRRVGTASSSYAQGQGPLPAYWAEWLSPPLVFQLWVCEFRDLISFVIWPRLHPSLQKK